MKRRVFSIIFLMLLSIYIGSATIKAAPPEGFDFNHVLNLIWTDQEAISQEGEFHLVSDEIDGMPYTIPMLANWLITADMGDVVGAFNSVDAIYPGHDVAYAYYIFMVDIEELHFYNFKMQLKKTVPFDELVSVTTDDPFVGDNTVSIQYMVDDEQYDLQIVNKGSQLTLPEDPEKENHVFIGWYSDPLFYYAYDPTTIVVNGFSLYAKFQLEDLIINIYNGSNLHQTLTIKYGAKIDDFLLLPSIENYIKRTYEVDSDDLNFDYIDEINRIAYINGLEWVNAFPSLLANNLQTLNPVDLYKLDITAFSTKLNYNLKVYISKDKVNWTTIWDKTWSNSNSNETLKYTFLEQGSYYIKMYGSSGITIKNIIFYEHDYFATGKNYVFDNWYYDENLTKPYHIDDIITADINLYAGYVEKKYELSFDSNDGSPVESLFYYEDDEILMFEYNPSRIGFVFAGWYLDEELEEEFNLEVMPGEDVTLYAKWVETEETQFLIEFYLGEELYTYIVLVEEQELILPTAPPAEENQLFLGWYYDEEFTESFKVSDPIDDDIVLYGKFGRGTMPPPEEPTTPGTGLTFKKEYIFYVVLGVIVLAVVSSLIRKRK